MKILTLRILKMSTHNNNLVGINEKQSKKKHKTKEIAENL